MMGLTCGCIVAWFCCSLLLRRECCTFSNGQYVKNGLAELELWCSLAKEEVLFYSYHQWKANFHFPYSPGSSLPSILNIALVIPSLVLLIIVGWCFISLQYAGSSWDELKYVRQAVGFLVSCGQENKWSSYDGSCC